MEEDTLVWVGVFGFAIAVIALLFSFGAGGMDYNFNQTQFINNSENISINTTWLSTFGNITNINNTYINQTTNLTIGQKVLGSTNNNTVLFVDGVGNVAQSPFFKYANGQLNLTSVGGVSPLLLNGNVSGSNNICLNDGSNCQTTNLSGYLKLNQSTRQTITDGTPNFKEGVLSDDTGVFDFITGTFGVPVKNGFHTTTTDNIGGFNVVSVNNVSLTGTGEGTVGGLGFVNFISGDWQYFGPATSYGVFGYNNIKDMGYALELIGGEFQSISQGRSIVDTMIGTNSVVLVTDASEATSAIGSRISVSNSAATITEAIGLLVQDVTGGATNYAIKTGLGDVQFGDDVTATNFNSSGNFITNGGTIVNADQILNGNFSNAGGANWTGGTGWTFATGRARKSADGTGNLTQQLNLITGEYYTLTYSLLGQTTTVIGGTIVSIDGTVIPITSNIKTHSVTFKALTNVANLTFTPSDTSARFSLDNIVLRRVSGIINGGSLEMTGNTVSVITQGAGTRMQWIPAYSAFRAGTVTGNQWNEDNIGQNSFGTGLDVKTSGANSFGAGNSLNITGANSFGSGLSSSSNSSQNNFFGWLINLYNDNQNAFGYNISMYGNGDTAIGFSIIVNSLLGQAFGNQLSQYGDYSTLFGSNCSNTLHKTFGIGYDCENGIMDFYVTNKTTFVNNLNVNNISTFNNTINQTSGNSYINNIYGEMYCKNDTGCGVVDLVTQDVYVAMRNQTAGNLNGFTLNGESNLTAQYSGLYSVNAKVALSDGSPSGEYGMKLYLNETGQNNCYDHFHVGGEQISMVLTCLVRINAGQNVSIRFDDHASPVSDLTVYASNLNLVRVGN